MSKELEQFAQLFDTSPNLSILAIDNGCEKLVSKVKEITDSTMGTLSLKEFSSIEEKRFRLTAREYEQAIVCNCLHLVEDKKKFLKAIYTGLENSASSIIIVGKKEDLDVYSLYGILEECEFRSANEIDILEEYTIVMATKMHMWD